MDNLVLVGFSCSGKTTIGRNLARRLRLKFVDTDRYIEDTRDATGRMCAIHLRPERWLTRGYRKAG